MKGIYAVILAGGFSRRLGFNKLTVKINGVSIIKLAVTPFIEAGIEKIFVVTGPSGVDLRYALAGCPVQFIENHESILGMATSAKAAVPFVEESEGVFFHLGDKPFLESSMVVDMVHVYEQDKGKIIVPLYQGHKGHPVLMDIKPYRKEIEGLTGDMGFREIIEKHRRDVLFIDGNEGSLFDVDTEQEVSELRKRGYNVEKG